MKQLKDYLHLYLGCMVQYKRFNEELQMYVLIDPRVLNADCLLTINMLYGEYSLIDVALHLRPLSDMTSDEFYEFKNICEADFSKKIIIKSVKEFATYLTHKFEATAYLLSKHFDLFGLIESGLAIDKTLLTLPV